jgi:predicted MFS family arabinose efflux permease
MPQAHESRASPRQLVALVCAAQVLVQLGAFFWPALLPGLLARWELTYGEAGWITAAFYGAYILAVPVLVTLTDRIDAKLVYLVGVANAPFVFSGWRTWRMAGWRMVRHRTRSTDSM